MQNCLLQVVLYQVVLYRPGTGPKHCVAASSLLIAKSSVCSQFKKLSSAIVMFRTLFFDTIRI